MQPQSGARSFSSDAGDRPQHEPRRGERPDAPPVGIRDREVRIVVTELALETEAPISTDDFRMLNRCLDDAIAGAVTEYGRERHRSALDGETTRESERLGFFAHELGNLINTGIIAFEILKTGDVGVSGSTGAVLQRSLLGLRALVSRSLSEIRLTEGVQNRERLLVAELIDDLAPAAMLEATTRGNT